jgi:flagellin
MLNRMRDLAVQASNGSLDSNARSAANNEITELKSEITRVGAQTKFGTQALLDGTYGTQQASASTAFVGVAGRVVNVLTTATVKIDGGGSAATSFQFQVAAASYGTAASYETVLNTGLGANTATVRADVTDLGSGAFRVDFTRVGGTAASTVTVSSDVANANGGLGTVAVSATGSGTGGVFQIGANANETISVSIGQISGPNGAGGLADVAGDVTTTTNAEAFITATDTAISNVSGLRGQLGAKQNRLESSVASLQVAAENLSASNSQIHDTDMAMEMTNFTKDQILMQAGTAMLGQANKIPQSVLSLLQG